MSYDCITLSSKRFHAPQANANFEVGVVAGDVVGSN